MGYDMSFTNKPGDGSDGYFRLNIWAMSRYEAAMRELGMVYGGNHRADWPEHRPYPNDTAKQAAFDQACEDLEYGDGTTTVTGEPLAKARDYIAKKRAALAFHPDGGDTIPAHKFGTNDGWHVTPAEIKAALAAYQSREGRDAVIAEHVNAGLRRAHWDTWINYLERAVDHDGFQVF